jgi:hypothetical protein
MNEYEKLDMVLDYLNEGIFDFKGRSDRKNIMKRAASVVSRILAENELGDCYFEATYGLFGSKKSNAFKNGKSKDFVLTVTPRENGTYNSSGSYYGSDGSGYSYGSGTSYSMNGVTKAAKFCKDHMKEINDELNRAIGPCVAKLGGLYKDRGYITLVITMK